MGRHGQGQSPHFYWLPEVELCGHGQPLFWGDPAQGHVGALVIVEPEPVGRVILDLGDRLE